MFLLGVCTVGQCVPAHSLTDAGGILNIHSPLSKDRDQVTDLMLHLLFLLLLLYRTPHDGPNHTDKHEHFKVPHTDGAEQFSTTTIEPL